MFEGTKYKPPSFEVRTVKSWAEGGAQLGMSRVGLREAPSAAGGTSTNMQKLKSKNKDFEVRN